MSSSYPNQSPHISKSADPKIPFIHKPYKSIPKQKSPLIKEEASFTEINKIS